MATSKQAVQPQAAPAAQATPPTAAQLAAPLYAAYCKALGAGNTCVYSAQAAGKSPYATLLALHTAYAAGQGTHVAHALAACAQAATPQPAGAHAVGLKQVGPGGSFGFWCTPLMQVSHGYVVVAPGSTVACPCGKHTYTAGVWRVVACHQGHKPTCHPSSGQAGVAYWPGWHPLGGHLANIAKCNRVAGSRTLPQYAPAPQAAQQAAKA
jgi:hypothetical protein